MSLVEAVLSGNRSRTQQLVRSGADVDAYERGGTALYHAVEYGRIDIASVLLEAGADPDVVCSDRVTALLRAVNSGDLPITDLLLSHRADPNRGVGVVTPYIVAARLASIDLLGLLHTYGADVNARNEDGASALMFAAIADDPKALHWLLAHGADVSAVNDIGRTALWNAAAFNRVDALEALLSRGAAVDVADMWGLTPLTIAARNGHAEAASSLLNAGASPNHCSPAGWTPLLAAVRGGHAKVVRLLLSSGADPNIRATNGWSVVTEQMVRWAAPSQHEITTLLRRGGLRWATLWRGLGTIMWNAIRGRFRHAGPTCETAPGA